MFSSSSWKLAREGRREEGRRCVVAEEERRRPAFWRVFWRVSSLVSVSLSAAGAGGEMVISVVMVVGGWVWGLTLEFLRMPRRHQYLELTMGIAVHTLRLVTNVRRRHGVYFQQSKESTESKEKSFA